jgi:hypothetical protein
LVETSQGRLQVVLLSGKPASNARPGVLALGTGEDRLTFGDRELYWLPSRGIRDSALSSKAIESLLGSINHANKGHNRRVGGEVFRPLIPIGEEVTHHSSALLLLVQRSGGRTAGGRS